MKLSSIVTALILVSYVTFFGITMVAAIDYYGRNSIGTIVTVLGLVILGMIMLMHKPLDDWINNLDRNRER